MADGFKSITKGLSPFAFITSLLTKKNKSPSAPSAAPVAPVPGEPPEAVRRRPRVRREGSIYSQAYGGNSLGGNN